MKNKNTFKTHIKRKVIEAAFRDLKNTQRTHSKVKDIVYEKFEIQPYMKSKLFTNSMVNVLFNLRSCMTKNFKSNFPSIFRGNMKCRLNCQELEASDCQSHILKCSTLLENLSPEELVSAKDLEYNHIFGTLVQQGEIVPVLSRMLELREELLEIQRLPVGQNIGPDSVVTNE